MSEPPIDVPPCLVDGCGSGYSTRRLWAVCDRHGEQAGEELAKLGAEFELLSAAPALGNRREGEAVHGGPLKSERSPVNLDVLVARDPRSVDRVDGDAFGNAAPAVLAWVLATSEVIRHGYFADAVARTWAFTTARARIAAHLDWVLAQAWAGEWVVTLHGHYRALARLNAAPAPRPRRSACRGCGSRTGLSWDPATGVAACSACGGEWSGVSILRGA